MNGSMTTSYNSLIQLQEVPIKNQIKQGDISTNSKKMQKFQKKLDLHLKGAHKVHQLFSKVRQTNCLQSPLKFQRKGRDGSSSGAWCLQGSSTGMLQVGAGNGAVGVGEGSSKYNHASSSSGSPFNNRHGQQNQTSKKQIIAAQMSLTNDDKKDFIQVNIQMADDSNQENMNQSSQNDPQKQHQVVHIDQETHQTARTARNDTSVINLDDFDNMEAYLSKNEQIKRIEVRQTTSNHQESQKESFATVADTSPFDQQFMYPTGQNLDQIFGNTQGSFHSKNMTMKNSENIHSDSQFHGQYYKIQEGDRMSNIQGQPQQNQNELSGENTVAVLKCNVKKIQKDKDNYLNRNNLRDTRFGFCQDFVNSHQQIENIQKQTLEYKQLLNDRDMSPKQYFLKKNFLQKASSQNIQLQSYNDFKQQFNQVNFKSPQINFEFNFQPSNINHANQSQSARLTSLKTGSFKPRQSKDRSSGLFQSTAINQKHRKSTGTKYSSHKTLDTNTQVIQSSSLVAKTSSNVDTKVPQVTKISEIGELGSLKPLTMQSSSQMDQQIDPCGDLPSSKRASDANLTLFNQQTYDKSSLVDSLDIYNNTYSRKMEKLLLTMEQQRRVINFDKFIPTLGGNKLNQDKISQTQFKMLMGPEGSTNQGTNSNIQLGLQNQIKQKSMVTTSSDCIISNLIQKSSIKNKLMLKKYNKAEIFDTLQALNTMTNRSSQSLTQQPSTSRTAQFQQNASQASMINNMNLAQNSDIQDMKSQLALKSQSFKNIIVTNEDFQGENSAKCDTNRHFRGYTSIYHRNKLSKFYGSQQNSGVQKSGSRGSANTRKAPSSLQKSDILLSVINLKEVDKQQSYANIHQPIIPATLELNLDKKQQKELNNKFQRLKVYTKQKHLKIPVSQIERHVKSYISTGTEHNFDQMQNRCSSSQESIFCPQKPHSPLTPESQKSGFDLSKMKQSTDGFRGTIYRAEENNYDSANQTRRRRKSYLLQTLQEQQESVEVTHQEISFHLTQQQQLQQQENNLEKEKDQKSPLDYFNDIHIAESESSQKQIYQKDRKSDRLFQRYLRAGENCLPEMIHLQNEINNTQYDDNALYNVTKTNEYKSFAEIQNFKTDQSTQDLLLNDVQLKVNDNIICEDALEDKTLSKHQKSNSQIETLSNLNQINFGLQNTFGSKSIKRQKQFLNQKTKQSKPQNLYSLQNSRSNTNSTFIQTQNNNFPAKKVGNKLSFTSIQSIERKIGHKESSNSQYNNNLKFQALNNLVLTSGISSQNKIQILHEAKKIKENSDKLQHQIDKQPRPPIYIISKGPFNKPGNNTSRVGMKKKLTLSSDITDQIDQFQAQQAEFLIQNSQKLNQKNFKQSLNGHYQPQKQQKITRLSLIDHQNIKEKGINSNKNTTKNTNSRNNFHFKKEIIQTSNSSGRVINVASNQDITQQIKEIGSGRDHWKAVDPNQIQRDNMVQVDIGHDNYTNIQQKDTFSMNQTRTGPNQQTHDIQAITTKNLSRALGPPRKNTQEIDKQTDQHDYLDKSSFQILKEEQEVIEDDDDDEIQKECISDKRQSRTDVIIENISNEQALNDFPQEGSKTYSTLKGKHQTIPFSNNTLEIQHNLMTQGQCNSKRSLQIGDYVHSDRKIDTSKINMEKIKDTENNFRLQMPQEKAKNLDHEIQTPIESQMTTRNVQSSHNEDLQVDEQFSSQNNQMEQFIFEKKHSGGLKSTNTSMSMNKSRHLLANDQSSQTYTYSRYQRATKPQKNRKTTLESTKMRKARLGFENIIKRRINLEKEHWLQQRTLKPCLKQIPEPPQSYDQTQSASPGRAFCDNVSQSTQNLQSNQQMHSPGRDIKHLHLYDHIWGSSGDIVLTAPAKSFEALSSYNILRRRDLKLEKRVAESTIATLTSYTKRSNQNLHSLLCQNGKNQRTELISRNAQKLIRFETRNNKHLYKKQI